MIPENDMAVSEHDLTPTEDLILELLVARHRLGEAVWPIKANSTTTRAIQHLTDIGLVSYSSGPSMGYTLTSLTDQGTKLYTDPKHKAHAPSAAAKNGLTQKWCPHCGGSWHE